MLLEDQHPHNKAIMIAVLGKPNAGKSTLINHLIGFDLSIVSSKPQTTRNNFHCAFTIDRTEVVLVDTPGIHGTNQELNKRMNGQAQMGAEGVDLNFVLLDLTTNNVVSEFKDFLKNFEHPLARTWIIFTKADLVNKEAISLVETMKAIKELCPTVEKHFVISTKDGHNVHDLTGAIQDASQSGPHLYPRGDVSNKNERFFVTEYIFFNKSTIKSISCNTSSLLSFSLNGLRHSFLHSSSDSGNPSISGLSSIRTVTRSEASLIFCGTPLVSTKCCKIA